MQVDEDKPFEPKGICICYLLKGSHNLRLHVNFFALEIYDYIPFFDESTDKHVLLDWPKQVGCGVKIVRNWILFEIEFIGFYYDDWRILVISPVRIDVSML